MRLSGQKIRSSVLDLLPERTLPIALVVALVAACGNPEAPPLDTNVASVEVRPESRDVWVGVSETYTASAFGTDGQPLSQIAFSWSSSDPAIAHVSAQGLATALTEGTVVLKATAEGVSGSADIDISVANFGSVTGGASFSCALDLNGTAGCWGFNFGELGIGSEEPLQVPAPQPVAGDVKFSSIDAGHFHVCAVALDGTAYCWGDNDLGQLGRETGSICNAEFAPTPCSLVPAQIGGHSFASISAGALHSCGLEVGGAALCWGAGGGGQLGAGSTVNATAPQAVAGNLTFASVSASNAFSCGLTESGSAYCWGSNTWGRLGQGSSIGPEVCGVEARPCSTVPVAVTGGHTFAQISVGSTHSCGLDTGGMLYCWGSNLRGELGVDIAVTTERCPQSTPGDSIPCSTTPILVGTPAPLASIEAGALRTCGVATDGRGFCWGDNSHGGLGIGVTGGPEMCETTIPCSASPQEVGGGLTWSRIVPAAITTHTCGVTVDDVAYCWGENLDGQLGINTVDSSPHSLPEKVSRQEAP